MSTMDAQVQSVARTASGAGLHKGRSAVTNGKRLFVVKPGDNAWSRRFRDVLNQIISDIGGYDMLSEGQRQLARRAATISITCEKMEGEAAKGNDIDLEQYGQLTDRLGRTFSRLGLKRHTQVRDVTPPSVEAYLEHKRNNRVTRVAKKPTSQVSTRVK
jgi:hypothetical protein